MAWFFPLRWTLIRFKKKIARNQMTPTSMTASALNTNVVNFYNKSRWNFPRRYIYVKNQFVSALLKVFVWCAENLSWIRSERDRPFEHYLMNFISEIRGHSLKSLWIFYFSQEFHVIFIRDAFCLTHTLFSVWIAWTRVWFTIVWVIHM